MRYLKLTVAYDGTDFAGWQVQDNGRSIQGELERAWTAVTGQRLRITGSGRTDAGVHASGQVASLATEHQISLQSIAPALNAHLPAAIVVRQVEEAPAGFHAIRDAVEKTYCYTIQTGSCRSPFLRDRCWFIPRRLELEPIRAAAAILVGTHDFASFQAAGAARKSTIRSVRRLDCQTGTREGFAVLWLTVTADGFLYNMVRNIVGTLVEHGLGKRAVGEMAVVLAAKDRAAAGPTAPAAGLCLVEVVYPMIAE